MPFWRRTVNQSINHRSEQLIDGELVKLPSSKWPDSTTFAEVVTAKFNYDGMIDKQGRPHGFGVAVNHAVDEPSNQSNDRPNSPSNSQSNMNQIHSRYAGCFKHGVRHGPATIYLSNGDQIEGCFKDDQLINQAIKQTFVDGSVYIGQLIDCLRNGEGRFEFIDGSLFTGSFANDLMHGDGVFVYACGDRFEGKFKKGMKEGQGEYQWANPSISQAVDQYVNRSAKQSNKQSKKPFQMNNPTIKWSGHWSNDARNGPGCLTLNEQSNERLIGEWTDNVPTGRAIYYSNNQSIKLTINQSISPQFDRLMFGYHVNHQLSNPSNNPSVNPKLMQIINHIGYQVNHQTINQSIKQSNSRSMFPILGEWRHVSETERAYQTNKFPDLSDHLIEPSTDQSICFCLTDWIDHRASIVVRKVGQTDVHPSIQPNERTTNQSTVQLATQSPTQLSMERLIHSKLSAIAGISLDEPDNLSINLSVSRAIPSPTSEIINLRALESKEKENDRLAARLIDQKAKRPHYPHQVEPDWTLHHRSMEPVNQHVDQPEQNDENYNPSLDQASNRSSDQSKRLVARRSCLMRSGRESLRSLHVTFCSPIPEQDEEEDEDEHVMQPPAYTTTTSVNHSSTTSINQSNNQSTSQSSDEGEVVVIEEHAAQVAQSIEQLNNHSSSNQSISYQPEHHSISQTDDQDEKSCNQSINQSNNQSSSQSSIESDESEDEAESSVVHHDPEIGSNDQSNNQLDEFIDENDENISINQSAIQSISQSIYTPSKSPMKRNFINLSSRRQPVNRSNNQSAVNRLISQFDALPSTVPRYTEHQIAIRKTWDTRTMR